jgi:hypothetical protein
MEMLASKDVHRSAHTCRTRGGNETGSERGRGWREGKNNIVIVRPLIEYSFN